MAEMVYCPKCNKTMADTNFYTYKDKSKAELCKACLTMHVNNWQEDTFLWLLEKFDVPYIKAEWDVLRDRAYQKDPYKMTGMSVFGKYLSKMKLKQWMKYGWADTERLAEEAAKKAEECANPNAKSEDELCKMKEAYENGDITEAEFLTYQAAKAPQVGALDPTKALMQQMGGPQGGFYPNGDHPYAEVELPDVGADLTEEDKLYLATKWGVYYSPQEWISLEKLYEDFIQSFDIQGAARVDTLKMICKTSLKANQAIDSGDFDTYQKLMKVYDASMKSAKFTEAQRKEEKTGDFDAVGQVVYFAEKMGGKIERYDTSEAYDLIDEKLANLKRYTKDLIMNDSTLAQEIENFMQRSINAEEQKKDLQAADAAGEEIQITDKNYNDYNDFIEQQLEEDADGTS